MLDRDAVKELLARDDLSNSDKLLTCLAADPVSPKMVGDVRELAVSVGLRAVAKWNVSAYFLKVKTLAVRTPGGWELTSAGKAHVARVVGPLLPSVATLVVSGLRKQLSSIQTVTTRSFVEEAVRCLEAKLHRFAIVISWIGAISVLYEAVIKTHLIAFNDEAKRRDVKWREAKSADDLTRMKEFDFLQTLAAISVLGKNVKDELEVCLKLRNGCGHPNSLIVGDHKASAHVGTLIENVFAKF